MRFQRIKSSLNDETDQNMSQTRILVSECSAIKPEKFITDLANYVVAVGEP